MRHVAAAIASACLATGAAGAAEPRPLAVLAMPGEVHRGPLPPLTEAERQLVQDLEADVRRLAGEIGERNATAFGMEKLQAAEQFLVASLAAHGLVADRLPYEVRGRTVHNVVAEVPGAARRDEILVIGGHYDSAVGTPGANDNASGVAATLALARAFAARKPARTVRFAFFVNEEPPWFQVLPAFSWVKERGWPCRGSRRMPTNAARIAECSRHPRERRTGCPQRTSGDGARTIPHTR